MNLKNIRLEERSPTQKATYHTIPFRWNVQDRRSQRRESSLGLWAGETGRGCFLGTGLPSGLKEMFWNWTEGAGAYCYDCSKWNRAADFKMSNSVM